MAIYFTSDQHFGHAAARGFYRRPFTSVAEMDREMIDRWNSVVEPGDRDEVWHLGDFAVRQSAERVASLLRVLHGRKHLITGNNDDAAVIDCDGWQSVQPCGSDRRWSEPRAVSLPLPDVAASSLLPGSDPFS
jgi:calcineurin-like phosphoesterase family protein